MSGSDQMKFRRWSAQQRLVVLTFDTIEAANKWDAAPETITPLMVTPIDFDAPTLRLLETCRDVIDEWDDVAPTNLDKLAFHVNRMRRDVFNLRQSRHPALTVVKP